MKIQRLQQKKWYVIDSKTSGAYSEDDPIKFFNKSIESSLFDYSDAYVLVRKILLLEVMKQKPHLKIVPHLENSEQK